MKRIIVLFLAVALLLSGCGNRIHDRRILVSIAEADGCTVENNGQYILPGEDAVFTLTLDRELSLTGTDYPGSIQIDSRGRTVTLTVLSVQYPTRISLDLSHDYASITYDANGGYALHSSESQITKDYSLSRRNRPNTDTGSETFAREGHTLICWNTKADGSGTRIGLGSRITVTDGKAKLYAQWAKWSDPADFSYRITDGSVIITGYTGTDDPLVIPEQIDGQPITAIEKGAFLGYSAKTIIFPKSLKNISLGAFRNCALQSLVLFDNIESIHDGCFEGCDDLQTLYINAIEDPFGYTWRKESCYADKVDMLIEAQGAKKLVFYGGCSMWYNLNGRQASNMFAEEYRIINMGLNGTVNSAVQMQIMGAFLEQGDVFFHAPELSSSQQMLIQTDMLDTDKSLWCGIENNYDLFSLVDLTTVGGVFSSLCAYLDRKDTRTTYTAHFTDDYEQEYMDRYGCIPFSRMTTAETLADDVFLEPERLTDDSMQNLNNYYRWYQRKGVKVYLSFACFNLDAVPEDQKNNAKAVEAALRASVQAVNGPPLLGDIEDFLYHQSDFFDTNYHLLSEQAKHNTSSWLQVLLQQMVQDELWKEAQP